MSNRGGFLWVIRVLQTVGAQIRAFGPRKWSDRLNFSIISVIKTPNYTFQIYLCPNVYILAQMSIFSPKCVYL